MDIELLIGLDEETVMVPEVVQGVEVLEEKEWIRSPGEVRVFLARRRFPALLKAAGPDVFFN